MNDVEFSQPIASTKVLELIGKKVTVYVGGSVKHSFDPAISIDGTLEQHQTDKDNFRVLVSDGTYSYFKSTNILRIVIHPQEFKDGSKAVIHLQITSEV